MLTTSISRRKYLGVAGSYATASLISGCTGRSGSTSGNPETMNNDKESTSSTVSDYIEWKHYFTDLDEIYDSVGIVYKISVKNVSSQELGVASRLKVYQTQDQNDDQQILNQAVRSDRITPQYTWTDGIGVTVRSLDALTRYTIEMYISEPGPASSTETLATQTFEYGNDEFQKRIK